MIGNAPYLRATWSSDWAFNRCCQSGVRSPGRRRGISSARDAFSRNRAPKSAESPTSATTRSSISAGSSSSSSAGGGTSESGKWSAIPSSDQIDCASTPSDSRSRAAIAIAHGACTRLPNGVRMQTRQSPISSRNRSTTIVRSDGTAPVASCCSRRKVSRFEAARSSRWYSVRRRFVAFASLSAESSRDAAPIFWPSSYGRPTPSPFQNGTAPGSPGAGDTSTRSRVISSIRHVDAPSRNVCPARASYTISSSSSPTRPPPSTRNTPKRPRSGIVPAFVTASRSAPSRARIDSPLRSQMMRGRSSANSSDG